LQATYLLNLDSEEHGSLCVGCAGGFEARLLLPVARQPVEVPAAWVPLQVVVGGLIGGHTGVDINRGRANATKLLARLLAPVPDILLISLAGGSVINTIPRAAKATLLVNAAGAAALVSQLHAAWTALISEYAEIETHPEFKAELLSAAVEGLPCTRPATEQALALLLAVPHGPLKMAPHDATQVATSISLSITNLHASELEVHVFSRADLQSEMDRVYTELTELASQRGAAITPRFNAFPGWAPHLDSHVVRAVHAAATEIYGKIPHVYSVHAGLEVGLISGVYPHLQCVSFGPQIVDAHTPDERLELATVAPFYQLLRRSLLLLTEQS
jgi:dipeptidase D